MSAPSRKRVRTLESFFASTRSPSQAEVLQNDTEVSSTDGEQNKAKEVTDESSERKTTSARSFQTRWLRDHTYHGCALKMERCFAIFAANRRRQIHLDQQAVQISEHELFRGIKIARIS